MSNRFDYFIKNNFFLELGKFGIVGIIRTIIGLLIIFVPYNLWGINYILCNLIAYSVGLITGFILHKNWVFKSNKNWSVEAIPYLITFGIAYILNVILLIIFAEIIMLDKNISQIISIFGFSIANFLLNKYWTFSKDRK